MLVLSLPFTFRYYFYSQPVDMRKSFNGLQLLIMIIVSAKELPGKMYIFLHKRKDQLFCNSKQFLYFVFTQNRKSKTKKIAKSMNFVNNIDFKKNKV
jgi:hypothetical protein